MVRSFRRFAAVSGAAAALAVGVPASASAAVSISVPATAQLTANVLVTLPVTVTCGPYELPVVSSGISVTIHEAVKRQVATGSAFVGFMTPASFLTCDGAPHVYSLSVLPAQDSPPFRKGDAVVEGFAAASTDCCTSDSVSVGPQVLRLR